MKTTINVPSSKEVEVSLPQYRRLDNEFFAFTSKNRYDNTYFRTSDNRLICYMAFCDISDINKGIEISRNEFVHAFDAAKESMIFEHNTNYYEEDFSTQNEDNGEELFNDFVKENYG